MVIRKKIHYIEITMENQLKNQKAEKIKIKVISLLKNQNSLYQTYKWEKTEKNGGKKKIN